MPYDGIHEFLSSEVERYAAMAWAHTRSLHRAARPATWQPPSQAYGLHIIDGQSLSLDAQGGPALTTQPLADGVLMIGGAPMPSPTSGPTRWIPYGTASLQPLIGTNNFNGVLGHTSPSPTTIHYEGEAPGGCGTYLARRLQLLARGIADDPAYQDVVVATGVSGQPIEALLQGSAGTPTGEWSRTMAGCDAAIALVGAANLVLASFNWLQGEANYSQVSYTAADGTLAIADGSHDGYLAQLENLNTAVLTEIVSGRLGCDPAAPPPFMIYQTASRTSTADALNLGVGMAQLDFSLAHAHTHMYGSIAPYPDNGVHGTANAYRWLESQRGKVLNLIAQGGAWEPLRPLTVVARGRTVLIAYHVPVGSLQFNTPFNGCTPWTSPDRGFSVGDARGKLKIQSVTIVMGTIIALTTNRAVSVLGDGHVRYADGAHLGLGCVCDSDPAMSDVPYVYVPGMMFPCENIPSLVGQPMPLVNWGVAFHMPVAPG